MKEIMKFSKEHEWIEEKEGLIVLGITDFAQNQLGDIVAIELPSVGDNVKKGQGFAIVDSMKASSDIFAPVSGEIIQVNFDLADNPEWLNEEPTRKGWIVKIKPANFDEDSAELMDEEQYKKFIGE